MDVKKTQEYYWIELDIESCNIGTIVQKAPELLLNKNLIIVSFDGDSFVPTNEELSRGWVFENEIAYFDNINIEELNGPIFDVYDQWLVTTSNIRINKMDSYVNYSGFSLLSENIQDSLFENLTGKFWNEIHEINPDQFILR